MPVRDIAARIGCTPNTVYNILYKNGIYQNQPRFSPREIEHAVALYNSGLTTREVAQQVGCSYAAVSIWIRKAGVDARVAPPPINPKSSSEETRNAAVSRYLNGESLASIAKSIGYSVGTVRKWVQASNHALRVPPTWISKGDKQIGIAMYEDGYTIGEIGEYLNCNPSTVFRWLKKAGIDTQRNR